MLDLAVVSGSGRNSVHCARLSDSRIRGRERMRVLTRLCGEMEVVEVVSKCVLSHDEVMEVALRVCWNLSELYATSRCTVWPSGCTVGYMSTINVTDARSRLPEVIDRAQSEAVFLERRGKLEAVVVSPAQYERMMDALEDAEDVTAFDAAMAGEGDNIPWAQAKADLGWV
jgi:antitoxin Phd